MSVGVGLIQLSLAPFQGDRWETLSPGLKPRAESGFALPARRLVRRGEVGYAHALSRPYAVPSPVFVPRTPYSAIFAFRLWRGISVPPIACSSAFLT